MQMGGCQVNVHSGITGPGSKSGRAERRRGERRLSESGGAASLRPGQLEALLLNIDASLRVHTRHHLFGWTQGMLQSVVKHELLVCALRSTRPTSYQVDCLASPWIDPEKVGEVFRRDAAFVAHLVGQWVESDFRPTRTGGLVPAPRMDAHATRGCDRGPRRDVAERRPAQRAREGDPALDSSRQEQLRDRNHLGYQPAHGQESRPEDKPSGSLQ